VVREYYCFSQINVLVIVDRLQSDAPSRSTTFASHCEMKPAVTSNTVACIGGSQEALYTPLVPAAPSTVIVAENANGATNGNWQYRIEANNNPGNVVSHNICAIQFADASGFTAITPTITDSVPGGPASGTFTISLDSNDSLSLNKGTTSYGGFNHRRRFFNPLTTTDTDAGPVWESHIERQVPEGSGEGRGRASPPGDCRKS
jgi:hypothetical protein